MKNLYLLCSAIVLTSTSLFSNSSAAERPNVIFIIADDASSHYGQAYGCNWVKTPNIDRLAKSGLVFDNAYTPTSKCAPSRAAILTGRNPWQLEDAANHQPYFPAKFTAFSEAISAAGLACGGAGKTWGPGEAKTADGKNRDFGMLNSNGSSPGEGFQKFLANAPKGKPFFYWYGSKNPHRSYKADSGIAAGKKTSDIDHVPAFWPDNDLVRRDMLDYAIEVEAFDDEVGSILKTLDASGLAKDTLVIVTSDHGMPFPRVKGHTIDPAHHIPFVACWPNGIKNPGRRVSEFISFIDLAPTFLELAQVDGVAAGMSSITGRSFTDLLRGESTKDRSSVIVGRERNDVLCRPGTPAGLGYPVRAIREGNLFYVHNFEPDRWPCGNPEIGFKDTDDSPTKQLIEKSGTQDRYWQFAFGKRPAEELYDLVKDPDCVTNLMSDAALKLKAGQMREKLFAELKKQNDPRIAGHGDVFDNYLSPRTASAEKSLNAKKKEPKKTKKAEAKR
ncbi:MAG: sulfatase [Pirellulaceae bacterium]|nr:sulfatase [Pirellulaceae bacterium]